MFGLFTPAAHKERLPDGQIDRYINACVGSYLSVFSSVMPATT